MKYKVVLKEFINEIEIQDLFREIARKKENEILIDFKYVKTIDRLSFDAILKFKQKLKLLGKKVEFCCIPAYIAQIISEWDIDIKAKYNDI